MEVFGNGHCVSIESTYNTPYTKVSEKGERKIYWVLITYEKAFSVIDSVSEIIKNHGKESDFYSTLGQVLKSKFSLMDLDSPKKSIKQKETKQIEKLNIVVDYAKIIYEGLFATINFYSGDKINKVQFDRRKSWSHKKYINIAIEKTGVSPSLDFRYAWEIK